MTRATVAKISLANIKHNYELANQFAPKSKNMPVIKANAYGHGAIEVAKSLEAIVPAFGVAIAEEAIFLRQNGINNNILIFQGVTTNEELEIVRRNKLWTTVHSYQQLKLILSSPSEIEIKIWLKVDTGMHRLGLNSEEFAKALKLIQKCSWIDKDIVISSHFSSSNELATDKNEVQLKRFNRLLTENSVSDTQLSIANSAALVNIANSCFHWNRPGIMLYGLPLFDSPHSSDKLLKPAMRFESEVISLREVEVGESVGYGESWTAERSSKIATIAVGYADGYPKQAQNGTPVFIGGQKAPLVGAVSMDLITVDVTDVESVKIGDKVELWGENLCANEVASFSGTIGYDLICGISSRVIRTYQ